MEVVTDTTIVSFLWDTIDTTVVSLLFHTVDTTVVYRAHVTFRENSFLSFCYAPKRTSPFFLYIPTKTLFQR